MAEIFAVNIDVGASGRDLIIPERIRVPKNTIVQWRINRVSYLLERHIRTGLIFTVYFPENSPFGWKNESLRLHGDYYYRDPDFSIKLAEGMAENTGDFKYGVKVSLVDEGEPIYDEDPYLEVF